MRFSRLHTLVSFLVCYSFNPPLTADEFQTTVTATKPQKMPQALLLPEKEANESAAHPWISLAPLGVTATSNAGALSFGDMKIHGFSSTYLRVTIDDFDLSNGGTGLIDPYDLPLFAAKHSDLVASMTSEAVGGRMAIELPMPKEFTAKARASFGSNAFGLADLSVASGDIGGSRALLGLQFGATRGNFEFQTPDHNEVGISQRKNNDHSRRLGFLKTQTSFSKADLEFFAFARQHEGGLAGPATFPTPHLRLLSEKAIVGSNLSFGPADFPLSVKWESRYDRNQTTQDDRGQSDNVAFMVNSLSLKGERRLELMDTYSVVESKLSSSQLLDGRYRRLAGRAEFHVNTAPFDLWGMRFRRGGGVQVYSDAGWFLAFATNISATPIENVTVGIRYAKNARPPTLSEMFAPAGLVLGNPDLHPEKANEGGIYLIYDHHSKLKLNLDLFYTYLASAIFYVNRNSFVIEPVNTQSVHRGGIGLSLRYVPTDFFESNTRVDWLHSYMVATGAPMPGAAPLAVSVTARIGKEKGVFGRISTVVNSGSTSNLFGTLKTAPYALHNASLHFPVLNHSRLILSVTNIADVKWARSAYQYPVPGREFFVTLESFT